MIVKDQNIALLTVGNTALKNPAWIEYANYCFSREKGLRKIAFKHLEDFLSIANGWSFEQKMEFVKFLLPLFETVKEADYGAFPQPLHEGLVKSTLEQWCEQETEDERPFRWYGTYYRSENHLLKALQLNPKDDTSRQRLLSWWTYNIYYSIHHLPEGYIGEPNDDLELAQKAYSQIDQLTDLNLKDKWRKELEENLEFVRNYIDWEKSGHSNFEQWGKENKKKVNYGKKAYYYEN